MTIAFMSFHIERTAKARNSVPDCQARIVYFQCTGNVSTSCTENLDWSKNTLTTRNSGFASHKSYFYACAAPISLKERPQNSNAIQNSQLFLSVKSDLDVRSMFVTDLSLIINRLIPKLKEPRRSLMPHYAFW